MAGSINISLACTQTTQAFTYAFPLDVLPAFMHYQHHARYPDLHAQNSILPKNILQQHPEVRFRYCIHICKIYYKNIQIYYAIH